MSPLLVLLGAVALLNSPPPVQDRAALDLQQARQVARESAAALARLGYPVDFEKLEIQILDAEAASGDIDRQQTMFFGEGYFSRLSSVYAAMGLIPEDDPDRLRREAVQAMLGSVQAYYQPDRKTFVLLDSFGGELGRALGGLGPVITHELVHAAQDQRSDLVASLRRQHASSEAVRIVHCMMEGEAEWAALGTRKGAEDLARVSDDELRPAFESALSGPAAVVYQAGRVFIAHRYRQGGWAAVREAFEDPPASTEQVLHPSKYPADLPRTVALPELGLEVLHTDVVGELQIYTLLMGLGPAQHEAYLAAAGWDGDRIVVARAESGEEVVVWRTLWDRPRDAEQFEAAMSGVPGDLARHGLVVDWVSDCSAETSRAVSSAMRADRPRLEPVAADAASTEAVESEQTARQQAGPRTADERWLHPELGLSIPIPTGWRTEQANGIDLLVDGEVRPGQFKVNVNVQPTPLIPGTTPDQVIQQNRAQIDQLPTFSLVFMRKERLKTGSADREPPEFVLYEMTAEIPGAGELHFLGAIFLHRGKQLTVTATTAESHWSRYEELLGRLIGGIRLLDE